MQKKWFWLSVLAVWVVMVVTDWVFHGMWLSPLYQATAQFWKPQEEAMHWMWVSWFGTAVFAWAFVWIYQKGLSQANVWHQAFRYGLAFFAVAKIPVLAGNWTYAAYPAELLWKWAFINVLQALACAFVMSWVYKPAWQVNWNKA